MNSNEKKKLKTPEQRRKKLILVTSFVSKSANSFQFCGKGIFEKRKYPSKELRHVQFGDYVQQRIFKI